MREAKDINVLVGCEESQAVCIAFRELGFNAYSCDIQECSGGHPEWHYQQDIFEVIKYKDWHCMVAFPPCTYVSSAGLHWCLKDPTRSAKRDRAVLFFKSLWNCGIEKIALENPVGFLNTNFQKHSQLIEPYFFGCPHKKRTCLWLKNIPKLKHIKSNDLFDLQTHVSKPEPLSIDSTSGKKRYFVDSKNRKSIDRSKTFPGIAKAMASQWGEYLLNQPDQA